MKTINANLNIYYIYMYFMYSKITTSIRAIGSMIYIVYECL